MTKKTKRPRDTNQLAKFIADVTSGKEKLPEDNPTKKNKAAVELGRLGGLKGGKARANKLTPEERKKIAQKAAEKRWSSKKIKKNLKKSVFKIRKFRYCKIYHTIGVAECLRQNTSSINLEGLQP